MRAAVREANAEAQATAPLEIGDACGRTVEVEGLGDTCRTDDGLLRVELEDGTTLTTHGADAPPLETDAGYLPNSQAAVDGASADDIVCAGSTTQRYELVYARPSDRSSRFATVAGQLQSEAMRMSAFVDAEGRSVDPETSRRLKFGCGSDGRPTVHNRTVRAAGSGGTFSQIVDDLRGSGLDFYTDSDARTRYLVYYDAPAASGAAGTGHLFNSNTPGTSSINNTGGMYAVEYRWSSTGRPNWNVLLHEAGHTMGAVPDGAPASSEAGHCTDGQDIMCYSDGGSGGAYRGTVCATEQFDCGRNTYFNPRPGAGSYMATHWNLAASYNLYTSHASLVDEAAPTQPTGLVSVGTSDVAASIRWNASTDASGVTSYRVWTGPPGGTWTLASTPRDPAAILTGLEPGSTTWVGVDALDAAGNVSSRATMQVTTRSEPDTVAPSAPPSVHLSSRSMDAVVIAWGAASDDVAIASYQVLEDVGSASRTPRSFGSTPATSFKITGLAPARTYAFRIVARDLAGNMSASTVTVTTLPDTQAPTAPLGLRATAIGRTGAVMAWYPAKDNVGIKRYYLYRGWTRVAVLYPAQVTARVVGLRPNTLYGMRVRALDMNDNLSGWSATRLLRTAR